MDKVKFRIQYIPTHGVWELCRWNRGNTGDAWIHEADSYFKFILYVRALWARLRIARNRRNTARTTEFSL